MTASELPIHSAASPTVETRSEDTGRYSRLGWRLMVGGFLVYLALVTAFLVAHGRFPTVDYLVPALFLVALLAGRGRAFVVDWAPFVVILLAYEQVRGIAYKLADHVHDTDLIRAEEFLFGSPVPTIRLQEWLYTRGEVMPWDVLATTFYLLHFVMPVALGFWIWLRSRGLYWRYILGLLALSYAGFATYVLFPAMPPWLAARNDLLPHVSNIFGVVLHEFSPYKPFYTVYENIDPNPIAAMPSLHVAFPFYIALSFMKVKNSAWSSLALLYPLAVTFSVVYLGHHYVIDCMAGVAYAVVFYALTWEIPELAVSAWARWRGRRNDERATPAEALPELEGQQI